MKAVLPIMLLLPRLCICNAKRDSRCALQAPFLGTPVCHLTKLDALPLHAKLLNWAPSRCPLQGFYAGSLNSTSNANNFPLNCLLCSSRRHLLIYFVCIMTCRLNAAEMFVDVSREGDSTMTNWVAESGVLDLFLLLGPTPRQVCQDNFLNLHSLAHLSVHHSSLVDVPEQTVNFCLPPGQRSCLHAAHWGLPQCAALGKTLTHGKHI